MRSRPRHRGGSWSISDGSNGDGCTVTLRHRDSDWTWTNEYPVYKEASFQVPESGIFRWDSCFGLCGAPPIRRRFSLPSVIVEWVDDSDAFKPPASIVVKAKNFHVSSGCGAEASRCRDRENLDIGELTEDKDAATLDPGSSALVYLYPGFCTVQCLAG